MMRRSPSPVPPDVTKRAIELLSTLALGESTVETIDGIAYEFVSETHTKWGADPDKTPSPHKGISVYFADV